MKRIICILFLLIGIGAVALDCAQCGKKITGRYMSAKGKSYCSEKCFEQTLPVCKLCGKHFREGMQITEDPSKVYCKECAAKPPCFNCRLPNDCIKLEDGRNICPQCNARAVFDANVAQRIFKEVRLRLKDDLKLSTDRNINLHMIGLQELERRSGHTGSPGQELGLYSYTFTEVTKTQSFKLPWQKAQEEKYRTNERYAIYFLYGMTEDKLSEVFAHELAHDWMQMYYPRIPDLKIREGWAEYVSYSYNKIAGQEYLNLRIEKNPDPVYGDGFRMIAAYVAKNGYDGLMEYFKESTQK